MPVVKSMNTWEIDSQENRVKKGKLVKVQLSEGRFVKMHEADAIKQGHIQPKSKPATKDKMKLPERDKMREPEGEKAEEKTETPVADFAIISGIGPATARLIISNGINTFDQLKEAGEMAFLNEKANQAIQEWRNSE